MTVSIHQPNFLPWLGYFHKLAHSDVFIFFDDVQYPRGKSFVSRVKVKTPQGEHWLTVPTTGKSDLLLIQDIALADTISLKKITRTLEVTYKKSAHFQEVFECVSPHLLKDYSLLCDLNIGLIEVICSRLQLPTIFHRSSELACNTADAEEKILCLLHKVKATTYISGKGAGSSRHINETSFEQQGMKLIWQDFAHPEYPQLYGGAFIPKLSIVDVLFNLGFSKTKELLMQTPVTP
jgi:hypothetical protein